MCVFVCHVVIKRRTSDSCMMVDVPLGRLPRPGGGWDKEMNVIRDERGRRDDANMNKRTTSASTFAPSLPDDTVLAPLPLPLPLISKERVLDDDLPSLPLLLLLSSCGMCTEPSMTSMACSRCEDDRALFMRSVSHIIRSSGDGRRQSCSSIK